ncbi:histidine kinase [Arsenicicoccus sp. oral taxon 190]|nr:histidine kinase [Arsenicicoccus sp. oral taxon 190]
MPVRCPSQVCDLDVLPDGVVVTDATGVVTAVNSRALAILGADRDAVLGADARVALPLQDLEGRSWWTCADPYGGLATRTRISETLLALPGDREVFLTATLGRERPRGPVVQVVVVLRAAAARRRAEQKTSALISTVAHELRSPLTSVKGFTSTLLRRWDRFSDDQKRLMLETIESDTDRITRLVAELLDVSRIDSGRLELRRQPVDLPRIVERHVEGLVASGHAADRFVLQVQEPLPEVWADPDRVEQVVANLMENALRHGAGVVTVAIAGSPGQDFLLVRVSDEGEGIPEESYPMVFTRFWHSTRRGGTGLGLYVVRGLVQAHGGTISVGRAPCGGAEFCFTLPAGAPEHVA